MSKTPKAELEETKHLMAALGRMKPKPHKEMKVGKKHTVERSKVVPKRKK